MLQDALYIILSHVFSLSSTDRKISHWFPYDAIDRKASSYNKHGGGGGESQFFFQKQAKFFLLAQLLSSSFFSVSDTLDLCNVFLTASRGFL